MTIHAAIESFATDLRRDGLGNDEHGKFMTDAYLARVPGIRYGLFPDRFPEPGTETKAQSDAAAVVAKVSNRFRSCVSTMVPTDYAEGYREALVHVLNELGVAIPDSMNTPTQGKQR